METLLAPAAPIVETDWAPAFLDELMARVGVDGLVAALRNPSLMASVEQHADGVRSHLADKEWAMAPTPLAGYGSAVLTAARQCGRALPSDPGTIEWETTEWYVLRLVAVCLLAEEHGYL